MKWLSKHRELLPDYIVRATDSKDMVPELTSSMGEEFSARMAREHLVWRFPNGWGASVSCSSLTRFNPELAVVRWFSKTEDGFDLDYTTGITSDVISDVSVSELALLLARIRGLVSES